MTKRFLVSLLGATVLLGCASDEDSQADIDAAAQSVMATVIGPDYAGIDFTPVLDCMIENTTTEERELLVSAALGSGVTGRVSAAVRNMEGRASTQSCIAAKGVVKPRLGGI